MKWDEGPKNSKTVQDSVFVFGLGTEAKKHGTNCYGAYGNQIRGNDWLKAETMVTVGMVDRSCSKLRKHHGSVLGNFVISGTTMVPVSPLTYLAFESCI